MSEQIELDERFVIDSDDKAEWALRKIREAEEEKARWHEHYKAMQEKVDRTCEGTINNMKRMLAEYFEQQPHHTTKTMESYSLPSGDLVLKHSTVQYDTKTKAEELLEWCKQNAPEYVKEKVTVSVDWAGLKKQLERNGSEMVTEWGEVVPGIIVTDSGEEFTVKIK